MKNQCKEIYMKEIEKRKTVGVFEPGMCSSYKIQEGVCDVNDYYKTLIEIVENINLPKNKKRIWGHSSVLGQETYYLKRMPVELCQTLGWKFTSVFKNLKACDWVSEQSYKTINSWAKAEIDELATETLEKVRLNLESTLDNISKENFASGIDSTGLISAFDHTIYVVNRVGGMTKFCCPKNPPI